MDEKIYLAVGSSLAENADLLVTDTARFKDHTDADVNPVLHDMRTGAALATVSPAGVVPSNVSGGDGRECADPVKQSDGSYLILCNTESYSAASDGDIVYEFEISDYPNDTTHNLVLDGVAVSPASGEGAGVVLFSPDRVDGQVQKNDDLTVEMKNGASVATTGDGVEGVRVENSNHTFGYGSANVVMRDSSSITTSGDATNSNNNDGTGAHGVIVRRTHAPWSPHYNSGSISVTLEDDASITTTGDGAYGVHADGHRMRGGLTVTMQDNVTITTEGAGAHGIRAQKNNANVHSAFPPATTDIAVDILGGSIRTMGSAADALYVHKRDGHGAQPVPIRVLVSRV